MLIIILIAVAAHYLLWQYGEAWLYTRAEWLLALLSGRPAHRTQRYDDKGIPVQLYRKQGLQYNPLFVAARARRDFDHRDDPRRLESFLRLSDWLASHAKIEGETLWLPYLFDLEEFELKAPWHSALAQAVAQRVFAQRWSLERDPVWLERYRYALNSLSQGSKLTHTLSDGSMWFLEYPSDTAPYVLNGMMGVLLELRRAGELTGDKQAQTLFDKGYQALLGKLDECDRHGFSLYSAGGRPASRNYHQMHIRQLNELDGIKPHPKLRHYARRWNRHDRLPVLIQLLYNPRPKRVAFFLLSLSGLLLLAGLIGFLLR